MCSRGFFVLALKCVGTVFVCGFAVISGDRDTRAKTGQQNQGGAETRNYSPVSLSLQLNELQKAWAAQGLFEM